MTEETPVPTETKKPWHSKIFTLNFLVAVAGIVGVFNENAGLWLGKHAGEIMAVVGALTAWFRTVSKKEISLK